MPVQQRFSLGFSPCPNDTFLFDALVNQKIDSKGLSFEPVLEDVEKLNKRAFRSELDITKLSVFAYAFVSDQYQILDAGAALGKGLGPLLISKSPFTNPSTEIHSVAIPGNYTTANFLFSHFYPEIKVKKEMIFSEIENAVIKGEVDAGVIIHENRFTYEKKGLIRLADLGTLWEAETNRAIPLGLIAVKRSVPEQVKEQINDLIRKSVEYAFKYPEQSRDYVRKYSQEMEEDVLSRHIDLYVNESTLDLGQDGRSAIEHMYEKAEEQGLISKLKEPIFIQSSKHIRI